MAGDVVIIIEDWGRGIEVRNDESVARLRRFVQEAGAGERWAAVLPWVTRRDRRAWEERLRTAGFELKIADTSEKMEKLKGLPQRKIVPYPHEGEMLYLYADAASCKCVYVGTPDAYQRYVEYLVAQGIAQNNARAAQANAAATTPYNAGVWTIWW